MAHTKSRKGTAIARLREERGWTQQHLAALVGWDHTRVSKIETGALSLSLAAVNRLAKAFKLHPAELLLNCLEDEFPRLSTTKVGKRARGLVKVAGRRKRS
jgi:transcriptional regulator with XRE-family HTH domain